MQKPFKRKKDFHIEATYTPSEVVWKAFYSIQNKYYSLYEKLDKMAHKPRINHTIQDARKAYDGAKKLTEFLKVAITRLEAYKEDNSQKDKNENNS